MLITWTAYLAIILMPSSNGWYMSDKLNKNNMSSVSHENYIENLEVPRCNDKIFLNVLAHFKIANPEDLFQLAIGRHSPDFCRGLTVGTDKVEQYLKHCYVTPDQDLYLKLLSGLVELREKLCDDVSFKDLYKRHAECYDYVQYEMAQCIGPEDWIELTNTTTLCNIMKSIIGCYYTRTLLYCDLLAAETLNDLMKSTMDHVSDVSCPNIVQGNYVRDLRSPSISANINRMSRKLLYLISSIILSI